MATITAAELPTLLNGRHPPCVSIYLPTARSYPDSQQNALRYKNLLSAAEETLRKKYPGPAARALLDKFHGLAQGEHFSTQRLDGLAVLGSLDAFHVYDLARPVPELAVVGDHFHVKPLVRVVQSADRFHLLGLHRDKVRLFEGGRDGLSEIRPAGVPWTVEEALGTDASGLRPTTPGSEVPRGHPAKGNDAKIDTERFFRAIDRAVWEHVSRPSGLPLLIAGVREHIPTFRAVSHNQHLLPAAVEHDPDTLTAEQLRRAAWEHLEPRFRERLERLKEDYRTAKARGLGTDDLATAVEAARNGRVGILLVDADRRIPGDLDPDTGRPRPAAGDRPGTGDLLDELAEQALRTKAVVVVVPGAQMPTATGLAAIFRY